MAGSAYTDTNWSPSGFQASLPQEVTGGYASMLGYLNDLFNVGTGPMTAAGGPLAQIASGSLWGDNKYVNDMITSNNALAQEQFGKAMDKDREMFGQAGLSTASPLMQYAAEGARGVASDMGNYANQLKYQNYNQQQQNTLGLMPTMLGVPGQSLAAINDLYTQTQAANAPPSWLMDFLNMAPVSGASGVINQPDNSGWSNLGSQLGQSMISGGTPDIYTSPYAGGSPFGGVGGFSSAPVFGGSFKQPQQKKQQGIFPY